MTVTEGERCIGVRLWAEDAIGWSDETLWRGEAEATELVMAGAAVLSEEQKRAPLGVLGEVRRRFERALYVDPALAEPKILAEVEDVILRGPVRRSSVAGHPLRWARGLRGGLFLLGSRLVQDRRNGSNILLQLRDVVRGQAIRHVRIFTPAKRENQATATSSRSTIKDRRHLFLTGDASLIDANEEWATFTSELEVLQARALQVFREGRVRCRSGPRLAGPLCQWR